ncbi:MAG: hypothetical protein C0624_07290 [Desulfuromonas sp.]|nr:MAG: hypothetical protein C0624_07290 [Desulfuromonas sp.]
MPVTIRRFLAPAIAGALLWVPFAWGSAYDPAPQLQQVLELRCTGCHTLERVNIALHQGRDLAELQAAMLARGAILSNEDKQILGTFWGQPSPVPQETADTPMAAPITAREAEAFERIIKQRCLLCHTRERIDDAIERRLPFEPIEKMMRARGASLTPDEQQTLQIFWGQPY